MSKADALIAVTPIFSASYSGLFTSFFDVLDRAALRGTPTLIAATGGTPRHSPALDLAVWPLFAYLRASIVPTAVYAASTDWGGDGAAELSQPSTGPRASSPTLSAGGRRTGHRRRSSSRSTSFSADNEPSLGMGGPGLGSAGERHPVLEHLARPLTHPERLGGCEALISVVVHEAAVTTRPAVDSHQ